MNRYLMMTAAALFGTTGAAQAGQASQADEIQFLSSNGGSYCDGMSFEKSPYSGAAIELGAHLQSGCGESNTGVAGQSHKKKIVMVGSWLSSTSFVYDISKPIKNGGTWSLLACEDQSSCFEVSNGTYKLGYTGATGKLPATTQKLAEILAARKAEHR
jgi:hypothetical protein